MAVSVVCCPLQMVEALADAVTFGKLVTVTLAVAVAVQPFDDVPVTVYVVLTVGVAVTDAPVEALSVVAGVHV